MHNIRIVAWHEIKTTLAKRSFWFTTFVFPVMIMAFALLPQLLVGDAIESAQDVLPAAAVAGHPVVGFVDEAGLVQRIPEDLPGDRLQRYDDRQVAQAALEEGKLLQYTVIPADYLATGELVVVTGQFSLLVGPQGLGALEYVLAYNLLGDGDLARRVQDPTGEAEWQALAPEPASPRGFQAGFGVSFVVMFILFFTITLSGGYMLQSVVKEKENRTAEVLLLSLSPVQLMMGKIAGLGVLALFQMAIWLGGGMLLMGRGQSFLGGLQGLELPPGFGIYVVLYFLLGFLVYCSALGALGALAPNVREGSQYTFIVILPLLVPLWFVSVFNQDPNGALATILSLFPLTAPTAMVTRLAAGAVPAWQPLVGLALLAATAYLFVRLAAHFFRADTLLSDASLNWSRLLQELRRA